MAKRFLGAGKTARIAIAIPEGWLSYGVIPMCLAVPGKVIEIRTEAGGLAGGRVGTVDFQGTRVEVGLAFVPEADVGDWVLVHAGFAINMLDEAEALETWKYLKMADLVDDLPPELQSQADPRPEELEPRMRRGEEEKEKEKRFLPTDDADGRR